MNFVKNETLKMWILWKMSFWKMWILSKIILGKCEFCQKWDFQNVNFCQKWDFEIVHFRMKREFLPNVTCNFNFQWTCLFGCSWPKNAEILSFRWHSEYRIPNGIHGWTLENPLQYSLQNEIRKPRRLPLRRTRSN